MKLQVPLRSSIMIKELPSLDEMEESGSSSMMTKVTEVIEKQQQVKVVTPVNSTEMLSKLLSEGKTYLDDLIKDGVDLSTIRNNNGMSLLHAAAASTSAYRMELIKEVVQRNLLSINDRSKVYSWLISSLYRMVQFLFTLQSTIIIWMLLCF